MSLEVTSEGIVIRRSDSQESDRSLVILTRDFGKTYLVARGARKSGSRLAGASEPLTQARYTWAKGKVRQFVTQCQPLTSFRRLREDYERLSVGLAIAEIIDQTVPADSPCEDIYDLLVRALEALGESNNPAVVLAWIHVGLLVWEGEWPDWTACAVSGERIESDPADVSATAGGALQHQFAGHYKDAFAVPWAALVGMKRLAECEMPPPQMKEAQAAARCLAVLAQSRLDRPLPAHAAVFSLWDLQIGSK
ncbi:MAG TPA: DNA repair protein RecO [Fimbriimonadaceae bacterium]|nr:DNA repair protein RecO [Armatimonadota bacterium]HCM74103.1 DNA repair protein RecO [Armatimonadota bacterium]HRD31550.1 DNA repair protein RecO [Fimbriimonadaceae bacterium]HRE93282.1 DNA repair protein RecO [Fimbriimonadaceae bacterium]HRI73099.1 DNA repair protein RecO [Fimbriimonadaceae bacterium]